MTAAPVTATPAAAAPQRSISDWVSIAGAIALAVLAYSGQLGASPILRWLPIGPTPLALSTVIAACGLVVLMRGWVTAWVVLPVALWVLFLFGALPGVQGDYATSKLQALMTLGLLSVMAPFFLLRQQGARQAFLATLSIAAGAVAVLTLTGGSAAAEAAGLSTGVLVLDGANTIGTARILGTGAVALLGLTLASARANRAKRLAFLLAGAGLVIVMVATGSRGPLAAVALGVLAVILTAPALRRRRLRSVLALSVATLLAAWWSTERSLVASDRAFAWLTGERDTSAQARQELWDIALDYIAWHPGGTGWGGFTTLPGLPPGLVYPHNLILELYTEGGWVIGTAGLLFMLASLWRLWRGAKEPVNVALFALAVFTVTNAMVSGDINDSRLMWMTLGVAWVPMIRPRAPRAQGRHHVLRQLVSP